MIAAACSIAFNAQAQLTPEGIMALLPDMPSQSVMIGVATHDTEFNDRSADILVWDAYFEKLQDVIKDAEKAAALVIVTAIIPLYANAQTNVDVNLASVATGTEYQGSHGPSALMTEAFLATEEGQGLLSRINSFMANEAYPDVKILRTCDFRNNKEGLIRYRWIPGAGLQARHCEQGQFCNFCNH